MKRSLSLAAFLLIACGRADAVDDAPASCSDHEILDGLDNDCDGAIDDCEQGVILCHCGGKLGLGTCEGGVGSGPCQLDCSVGTSCGAAKGHATCADDKVTECVPEPIECTTSLRTCPSHPGHLDCSAGSPGICVPLDWDHPGICPLPGCLGGATGIDSDGNGNSDNDDDALPDCWETDGGVDIDADGTLDLELPEADPNRKNLWVELDYMPGHRPLATALTRIQEAFAAAPTPAPAGITPGIILTFEPRMDEVPHADYLAVTGGGSLGCTSRVRAPLGAGADFDQLKQRFFGTAADRALDDAALDRRRRAKSLVYRYGIFGHYLEDGPDGTSQSGVSGCAELHGNDLAVTLAAALEATLAARGGTAHDCDRATGSEHAFCQEAQAAALMHELGHTLGLRHAGATDGPGCKPNYVSVMNYAFQFNVAFVNRRLDYSRGQHIRLDEAALSEQAGLGPDVLAGTFTNFGPSPVTSGCGLMKLSQPSFVFSVAAHGAGPLPINWDRDCAEVITPLGPQLQDFIDPEPVAVDLNDFGFPGCGPSPGEVYDDHDDWAALDFDFSRTVEFAEGMRSNVAREALTPEIIQRLSGVQGLRPNK